MDSNRNAGVESLAALVRDPPEPAAVPIATTVEDAPESAMLMRKNFWLIAFPILGISVVTFGVMGSLVPFLTDLGVTAQSIAVALSVAGIVSWISRVLVGYAMDRLFAPYVAAAAFATALLGIALLASGDSVTA